MADKPRGRPRLHDDTLPNVQALERGLALLAQVARHPGLLLSDLAEATGQPVATTFRALATLRAQGWAEVDARDGWHIGPAAFRTGAAFLNRNDLLSRARRPMQELRQETGETVSLCTLSGDRVVFLSEVPGEGPLRATFAPGETAPAEATAPGRALLSALPETELPEHAEPAPGFLRELARIRERGFALDDEGWRPGLRILAAPVFDAAGRPLAALAVSAPAFRLSLSAVTQAGRLVRAAAEIVTEELGGESP